MFQDINLNHVRHIVDIRQTYETYISHKRELFHRYKGTARWRKINGREYLYRRIDGIDRSLGPRSDKTEKIYREFKEGRDDLKARIKKLDASLKELAGVSRAYQIQRVPRVAARVLRQLDEAGILGEQVRVVGANAIYAYEANAGVRIEQQYIATGDVDLLFDARRRLHLIGHRSANLLALLKKADRSFVLDTYRPYRAINEDAYMVDLIAPHDPRDPLKPPRRADRLDRTGCGHDHHQKHGDGDARSRQMDDESTQRADDHDRHVDDLAAQPIEGLIWLESSPPFESYAIAEDGRPVRIATVDPRAFAAHKIWLSKRPDREPLKARRDFAQAEMVLNLIREKMPMLSTDDKALSALPIELRRHLKTG